MRVKSFDIVRGWAIFLMIMAHTAGNWMAPDSNWLQAILFIILNPGGTPGFMFASGLGFGFSWTRSKAKNDRAHHELTLKTHSRSLVLIILGFIMNFIRVMVGGFQTWTDMWFWNLILTIGVARYIGTLVADQSRAFRFLLTALSIAAVPLFVTFLLPLYDQNWAARITFFLLFNPLEADGILIFLPFFLVGALLGESVHKIAEIEDVQEGTGVSQINPQTRKILLQWTGLGAGLVLIAIAFSIPPWTIETGWNDLVVGWLNTHPEIQVERLPLMFTTNSFAWVIYSTGFSTLLTIAVFYYYDLKRTSKRELRGLFGKYSLTVYLGHQPFFLLPVVVTYQTYFLVVAIFEVSVWLVCYGLDRKWHQKVSLEAIILISANGLYDLMLVRHERKHKSPEITQEALDKIP